MVTRYDQDFYDNGYTFTYGPMTSDVNGSYVLYEDYQKLEEQITFWRERSASRGDHLARELKNSHD